MLGVTNKIETYGRDWGIREKWCWESDESNRIGDVKGNILEINCKQIGHIVIEVFIK